MTEDKIMIFPEYYTSKLTQTAAEAIAAGSGTDEDEVALAKIVVDAVGPLVAARALRQAAANMPDESTLKTQGLNGYDDWLSAVAYDLDPD